MAQKARTPEFWAGVVAESRSGGLPHTELGKRPAMDGLSCVSATDRLVGNGESIAEV